MLRFAMAAQQKADHLYTINRLVWSKKEFLPFPQSQSRLSERRGQTSSTEGTFLHGFHLLLAEAYPWAYWVIARMWKPKQEERLCMWVCGVTVGNIHSFTKRRYEGYLIWTSSRGFANTPHCSWGLGFSIVIAYTDFCSWVLQFMFFTLATYFLF